MVPYASFRFNGKLVQLTQPQFDQALRDSTWCACNACLTCRTREYARENGVPVPSRNVRFPMPGMRVPR